MQPSVDNSLILKSIDENGSLNSLRFSELHKLDHEIVKGALNSLALKNYVELSKEVEEGWILDKDGEKAVAEGTIEYRIWEKLSAGPVSQAQLTVSEFG